MTETHLEEKISRLTDHVMYLTDKIDIVETRLAYLEKNRGIEPSPDHPAMAPLYHGQDMPPDELWSSFGKSSFLPRVATVCFILVFALVLRTLADSGLINHQAGSFIGIGYASLLIAAGWLLISQKNRLAPVFPVCGALLMYVIVIETHTRFEPVTSLTAYAILFLTMLTIVRIGLRFQVVTFLGVGLIGASVSAMIIDFPRPAFYQLAVFLFATNIIAFMIAEKTRSRWIQITLFILTLLFWFIWMIKLHFPLSKGLPLPPGVSLSWFIPLTLIASSSIMAYSIYKSFHKGHKLEIFEIILPTVNIIWSYAACWAVLVPWLGHDRWLGIAGVVGAIVHYGVAGGIFKFSKEGGPGICSFTFAGSSLLIMAAPAATGNILIALPFWGAVALGLTLASQACEVGGIRLTSYLMQILACSLGVAYGVFSPGTSAPYASILVAAFLAVISGIQYFWSRKHPLTCSSGLFTKFDPADRSAHFLLIVSLINGFFMLQLGAYLILATQTDNLNNALIGAQSLFINTGAIFLLSLGLMQKHKEILYTAIALALIGAFKVFGYDLFNAHGIPLVISVFSFGAVAAVGSVVLGRWPQTENS
ncbi:MAG: hypothetical protein KKE17_01740 [Proteobacteria bacterium]|nr:hypothetical protein [Pseudomonadota bacterium]MBU1708704.1 hypothetical protein [Pseudomonadota bacterium]